MQFVSSCKTAITKYKTLTCKPLNSSKTSCSEQGQAKFDLSQRIGLVYFVTQLYAILSLYLCREWCLHLSAQSFLLLLFLPNNFSALQLVSAGFCRCADIVPVTCRIWEQAAAWSGPVLRAFCLRACSMSSWCDFKGNSCRKQLLETPQVQEELTVNH